MDATDKINAIEDRVIAMEFAFMSLAKALHDHAVLPIPVLLEHLQASSAQLLSDSEPDGLAPVGEQLDSLRAAVSQLR